MVRIHSGVPAKPFPFLALPFLAGARSEPSSRRCAQNCAHPVPRAPVPWLPGRFRGSGLRAIPRKRHHPGGSGVTERVCLGLRRGRKGRRHRGQYASALAQSARVPDRLPPGSWAKRGAKVANSQRRCKSRNSADQSPSARHSPSRSGFPARIAVARLQQDSRPRRLRARSDFARLAWRADPGDRANRSKHQLYRAGRWTYARPSSGVLERTKEGRPGKQSGRRAW